MSFLKLTHVYKVFSEIPAVEDFILEAEQGEFISFLGPSGCEAADISSRAYMPAVMVARNFALPVRPNFSAPCRRQCLRRGRISIPR